MDGVIMESVFLFEIGSVFALPVGFYNCRDQHGKFVLVGASGCPGVYAIQGQVRRGCPVRVYIPDDAKAGDRLVFKQDQNGRLYATKEEGDG